MEMYKNEPMSNLSLPAKTVHKVLVVEDEPFWQLLIQKAIQKIDMNIKLCFSSDVPMAMKELNEDPDFDFIIADHQLKGTKTGLDLWDILQTHGLEIPYILLSGTCRDDYMQDLMPYRTDMIPPYLEKPKSIRELTKSLSRVFYT